jgi:hypothetical protein
VCHENALLVVRPTRCQSCQSGVFAISVVRFSLPKTGFFTSEAPIKADKAVDPDRGWSSVASGFALGVCLPIPHLLHCSHGSAPACKGTLLHKFCANRCTYRICDAAKVLIRKGRIWQSVCNSIKTSLAPVAPLTDRAASIVGPSFLLAGC